MNTDLHGHTTPSSTAPATSTVSTANSSSSTTTTTTSYNKPLLSNSSSGGSLGNTRFDFVILSKLDKDGNLNLLHTKPLSVEILNQIPDSVILFSEGAILFPHFVTFPRSKEVEN